MDILLIVLVVLLIGGGGWGTRGYWYRRPDGTVVA